MPTVDAQSRVKHITTHTVSNEMLELWKAFPGVRAIVLHLKGPRSERPHYHIWMELAEPMTNEKVKNQLREYNVRFAKPFSDWKFTIGNEGQSHFVTWSNYVVNASKGSRVLYETPDETHPPLPEFPIVAAGGAGTAEAAVPVVVLKKPSARAPQRVQFVAHMKTLGWKDEEIRHHNKSEKLEELIKELTEWSENAFTTPNGAVIVQHALWCFADPIVRNMIVESNKAAIRSSIRLPLI